MRANESKSSGLASVLLGTAALALAATVGAIDLLKHIGDFGPKVGDIVTFDPRESFSRDMRARIKAMSADALHPTRCVLDVQAMHDHGGSLVIEARLPQIQRGFRVHWAGRHTSNDGAECGTSAELLVNQDDLEVMAIAAGGFGVAAAKLVRGSLWSAPAAVQ